MILHLYYENFGIYSMFLWLFWIFGYGREIIFLRPLRRNNIFPALPKFGSIVIKNIRRLDGFLTKWPKNSLFPWFFSIRMWCLLWEIGIRKNQLLPPWGIPWVYPFPPRIWFFLCCIFWICLYYMLFSFIEFWVIYFMFRFGVEGKSISAFITSTIFYLCRLNLYKFYKC